MKDDPALKRQLGKKCLAINAGGNNMKDVPEEVVFVTEAIHNDGLDSYTLSKVEVIERAHNLLVANPRPVPLLPHYEQPEPPATNGEHTDESVPEPDEPKAKVKPKAKAKAKAEAKPKLPAKAKAKAKATADAEVKPKPPAKAKGPPVPKAEATADRPTAVEPAESGDKGLAAVSQAAVSLPSGKPEKDLVLVALHGLLSKAKAEYNQGYLLPSTPLSPGKVEHILKDVPRVTGLAVINLGYAMIQLFEPFMLDPEVKALCDRLLEWINEIHRRTIDPSAEKETPAG